MGILSCRTQHILVFFVVFGRVRCTVRVERSRGQCLSVIIVSVYVDPLFLVDGDVLVVLVELCVAFLL